MAKKLIVPIVADSAAFKRGLRESETAAKQFEGKIKGTTSHVRTHILGMGAAFVGVGGFVEGVKVSVEAAEDLEKSTRGLDAQLKANHESLKAITPQLATLGAQMAKVGFTNSQTEQAFTRLDRASGSSAAAFKYMGVTADFAAAKHIDLSQAALIVGKVMTGTTSAMNRYGIAVPKGASATEALAIAQQKLAGQAEAGATPMTRFHAVLTNMEATIGQALLPTIAKYLDKVSEWFSKTENQRKVTDAVKAVLHDLGVVLGTLKDAFDRIWPVIVKVKDAFGDWKPLIVAAGAALVALGVLSPWTALAVGAVYVITHWQKVKTWFEDLWARLKAGFDILWDAIKFSAVKTALAIVEPFSHLPAFLGGWARDAKKQLNTELGAIESDMGKHVDTITAAWGKAGKDAGASWASGFTNAVAAQKQAIADSLTHGTGVTYGPGGAPMSAIPGMVPSTAANPQGIAQGRLSPSGIRALLKQAGATDREANFLTAISGREDGSGDPRALNDSLTTHDYSVGLFQINFRDMRNRWMRGGKGAAARLAQDPLAQAKYALGLLHGQGPSAWSTNTPAIQALLGGSGGGGGGGGGSLPGDAASAAAADKAGKAAARRADAAARAAAKAAYQAWKEDYLTPLDNEFKSDVLIANESKRLNKLQALHAKLAIDLKNSTREHHQAIFNEETKVAAKIKSLREKMANEQKAIQAKQHAAYVKGLQDDLSAAQTSLTRQQTVFDRAWNRITAKLVARVQAKFAAKTPEEQARDDFQAQLDAAQRAADLGSAQNDLIAAQLAGDPDAVRQAQAHLGDVQNQQKLADLQESADKSRAIQNAASDVALQNLNDWLDDQKAALEGGTETWAEFWQTAFSDAPEKYVPDAISSLQGVIDQLQKIKDLQDKIDTATGSGGGGDTVTLGGLTVPAGVIGHGFGGGFKDGGIVPGALGQPMMILAHGGETVTPVGGGTGGGNVVVHVYGDVTGDELIQKVVDGINSKIRDQGAVLRAGAVKTS